MSLDGNSEIRDKTEKKNPVNSLTAVYILAAVKLSVIQVESSFDALMVVHSLWSLTRLKSCNGCMVNHYMTVMSGETFRKLNLDSKNLDTKNLPTVVGANGTSLGAIGKINCEIEIGKKTFKQTFLVCENLTWSLILGVDFAKQHAAGVHWTKHNSFVLTIDRETVVVTKELHNKAAVSLKKRTKLPPRSCAVVDVDINTTSTEKVQLVPHEYCITSNPNMYMYNLFADLSEKTKDSVTPFIIVNLSNDQYLEFPKNHVVAFAEKDDTEREVLEIEQVDITPRNWIPARSQ